MKPGSRFSVHSVARRQRRAGPIVRYAVFIIIGCVASGCAHDVVVQNPLTGTTEVCRESLGGFDPWSQTTGCVADHVAQGWTRSDQE
jgi:hypothetical protein